MTRSSMMAAMDCAAADGQFAVQRCGGCGIMQYPPRELCFVCLSDEMNWENLAWLEGEVLATTTLHHSHEPSFASRLPLRLGTVLLDDGPSVLCFTPSAANQARVRVTAALDDQGRAVLTAELAR